MCSECIANLARNAKLLRPAPRAKATARLMPGKRPTSAQLERHAVKFGPAQVAETAAELGVSVMIQKDKPVRRASGPSLKARVATMVRDGHSVETIAEVENLSPSRARRLVEEAS